MFFFAEAATPPQEMEPAVEKKTPPATPKKQFGTLPNQSLAVFVTKRTTTIQYETCLYFRHGELQIFYERRFHGRYPNSWLLQTWNPSGKSLVQYGGQTSFDQNHSMRHFPRSRLLHVSFEFLVHL